MKKYLIIFSILFTMLQTKAQNYNLIIGTYTNKGNSEGIYVYDYDTQTATTKLKNSAKSINPSYLTVSDNQNFVFAVNEDGKNSTISSFGFNAQSGDLNFIDKIASEGADPCFITTNGNQILVANYSGGSAVAFYAAADGKFLPQKQVLQHTGKSINPDRQASAHVHQIQLTPDKKYAIVNDLGEDQVYIYNLANTDQKELSLKSTVKTTPGAGPRHLSFSPNGKFAYLTHEFTGVITVYKYDDGSLTEMQKVETVAKDFKGKIDAADIHVSADGKFLYQTNRGNLNTISLFAIAKNGKLKFKETISTLGKGPRNFTIDPSGKHLLVAHQYTNDVVIFNRDLKTGKLSDSGKRINVGVPVCLVFNK